MLFAHPYILYLRNLIPNGLWIWNVLTYETEQLRIDIASGTNWCCALDKTFIPSESWLSLPWMKGWGSAIRGLSVSNVLGDSDSMVYLA